jgi:hypothetical protein
VATGVVDADKELPAMTLSNRMLPQRTTKAASVDVSAVVGAYGGDACVVEGVGDPKGEGFALPDQIPD